MQSNNEHRPKAEMIMMHIIKMEKDESKNNCHLIESRGFWWKKSDFVKKMKWEIHRNSGSGRTSKTIMFKMLMQPKPLTSWSWLACLRSHTHAHTHTRSKGAEGLKIWAYSIGKFIKTENCIRNASFLFWCRCWCCWCCF